MSKKSGFLFGAVIGAAAALFLAPKKGSELREEAGKIYDDFKENPQEKLNTWRDSAVDFSADKFNEIKEKFDSGELSAEKAKDYLLAKRDLIKEKVDSGELSKDTVIDFFNDTRDAIVEKINTVKLTSEELFEEELFDEEESGLSDEVIAATAEFNDKKEEVEAFSEDKLDEAKAKLEDEANKIAEKAKSFSEGVEK
jgi:gas vesicle protein